MAIKLNIDEQIQNTALVTIGGHEYDIAFNDKFQRASVDVLAQMGEMLDNLDKLTKEDKDGNSPLDDLSADELCAQFNGFLAAAKKYGLAFFNEYLGDGSGDRIFKFYHEDTTAIMRVIGILRDQSEQLLQQDNRETRRAKAKEYTKNNKPNMQMNKHKKR